MSFEHLGGPEGAASRAAGQASTEHAEPALNRLKMGPASLARLQRSVGNQAVGRLLGRSSPLPAPSPAPAPMLLRVFIQRVSDFEPTKDRNHPALALLLKQQPVNAFGPWTFRPTKGDWTYDRPTQAIGLLKYLAALRTHSEIVAPHYDPEKIASIAGPIQWTTRDTHKQMTLKGGFKRADEKERVQSAVQELASKFAGRQYTQMLLLNKGSTPRQFTNIAAEDALGASVDAHIQERHVLGGAMMPDALSVAWRAAFGELGGPAQQKGGNWAGWDPTSSAFNAAGDANAAISAALNTQFYPQWKAQYRQQLLTSNQIGIMTARAAGAVTGYKSLNPGKEVFKENDKPAYLVKGALGQRPLYYPDPAWDAWAANLLIPAKEKGELSAQPLTKDVSGALPNVQLFIVPTDAPGAGGWVVTTAYPRA